MAINPLVVFVGLSVTTFGGLVVVNQQRANVPVDAPPVVAKQQTPLPEPVVKAPESKTTKVASLPETKKLENPAVEKTAPALIPSFDVVRVEEDGGAVVVGKAAPGADVVLKLDGKIFGKTKANAKGDWVFVPDQLVPKGNHELIIEATGSDKKTIKSKQSILIAMPKNAKEKPLVVVSNTDAPTKVLQQPETTKKTTQVETPAAKTAMVEPAKKPVVPAAEEKKKSPAEKPAKKIEVAKLQPAEKITKTITKTITETIIEPKTDPTQKVDLPKTVVPTKPLVLGTVDYNDQGDIVFTGKATPGQNIRLYVDNKFVGSSRAQKNGQWVFRGKEQIKPGPHELRADQVNEAGNVVKRSAVPFVRANPSKVAALLDARKKKAKPVAVAAVEQPAPQPAVTPVKKAPKVPVAPKVAPTQTAAAPRVTVPSPEQPAVKVTPPVAKKVTPEKVAPEKTTPEKVVEEKVVVASKSPEVETKAPVPAPATQTTQPAQTTQVAQTATQPVATKVAPDQNTELVSHVLIQPGNNLWNISRVIYGQGIAYTTIFQANKDQIKNPHRIYPGQILTTPGTKSSGSIAPDRREPLDSVADANSESATQQN